MTIQDTVDAQTTQDTADAQTQGSHGHRPGRGGQ